MNDIVIKAENLGKLYRIGSAEDRDKTFRETLADMAAAPFRRIRNAFSPPVSNDVNPVEFIWALKDVNFEVKRGEIVGIIGRNGAGKSTLLKILSRITEPTEGRVIMRGRVGSLLEVGTGFHAELTGEENIYLSGTILGMSSSEISRKFDEIIAFAEVEKFIHMPVKHYSTGMYLRLAFSVAAHLEPEILVIDEVLAVGDVEFQKKCLGKMGEVAHEGRTVLFVSHNMNAIQRLCQRCIVISQGLVAFDGEVSKAINFYLKNKNANHQISWPEVGHAPGNDVVRLRAVRIVGQDGTVRQQFDVRDPMVLEIEFQVYKKAQIAISVQFIGPLGNYIMASMDNFINGPWGKQPPYLVGTYRSSCFIPGDLLNEGQLSINLWIYSPPFAPNQSPHVRLLNVVSIDISDSHDLNGARGGYPFEWGIEAAVRPKLRWTTEQVTKNKD